MRAASLTSFRVRTHQQIGLRVLERLWRAVSWPSYVTRIPSATRVSPETSVCSSAWTSCSRGRRRPLSASQEQPETNIHEAWGFEEGIPVQSANVRSLRCVKRAYPCGSQPSMLLHRRERVSSVSSRPKSELPADEERAAELQRRGGG